MNIKALLIGLASGALLATAAQASGGVKVGTLECEVAGGPSYILGSSRDMNCKFKSLKGKTERYVGKLDKIGIDIGQTDKAVLGWAVFSAGELKAGALSGTYVGAAADASVGVGGGAKLLVGGSSHAFTLQPLSFQAQTGINVALAIASMSLTAKK